MVRKTPITHTKRAPECSLSLVPSGNDGAPPVKRYRLNSLGGIRREMAQIYKLARTGELPLADACRYGYLLTTLGKLSESELIEDRLKRLERTLGEKEDGNKH